MVPVPYRMVPFIKCTVVSYGTVTVRAAALVFQYQVPGTRYRYQGGTGTRTWYPGYSNAGNVLYGLVPGTIL